MYLSRHFLLIGFFLFSITLLAQFGAPVTIDDFIGNEKFTVVDFDGDGDQDIYYLKIDEYLWYENQGNAQFLPPIPMEGITENLSQGKFADMDMDGDLDWVFYNYDVNTLSFYTRLQNDEGNFGEPIFIYTSGVDFYTYDVVDFNGDGYPDLLFTEAFNGISLHYNSGDFADTEWERIGLGGEWDYVVFHVGDYDNDGDIDITGRHTQQAESTAGVIFHGNNGDGTFSSLGNLQRTYGTDFHHTQFDFDEDGIDEMMFPSNQWQWFTLQDDLILHLNDLPNRATLAATDIDQDGREDLVWKDGSHIFWTRFLGDLTFSDSEYTITNEADNTPGATSYFVDMNGDGAEDLVLKLTNGSLVWLPNEQSNGSWLVRCFYDQNENGTQEEDEPDVEGIPIRFNDGAVTYYSDALGQVNYFELLEEDIDLSIGMAHCWFPTDGITSYNLSAPTGEVDTLTIGFSLADDGTTNSTSSFTEHSTTRCFWPVEFSLLHLNSSCQTESGVMALRLDPTTTLLETSIPPDLIEDDVLWWTFDGQIPGESLQWTLSLLMPDEQATGAELHFDWYFFSDNCEGVEGDNVPASALSQGLSLCDSDSYDPVVRCSYDPNDKQVQPFRDGIHNYTLFEEELTYTVRFQNTGNDTAFNVHVRDYLDPALDWSSLQTLGASHDYELSLNGETGEIDYYFRDILLPDSTTNEAGSHGFVQYRIRAREDLPEHTVITNEARVYFDVNPAIVTNTVQSEMVTELPNPRAPEALFELGVNNLKIWLKDLSLFAPVSWQWDFGDGTVSAERHPQHTYATEGVYEVCLTVENAEGTDQLCRTLNLQTNSQGDIAFAERDPIYYNTWNPSFLVDAADVNGDGLSDAVVANVNNTIQLLINNGNNDFDTLLVLSNEMEEIKDLQLADLDNDGDQDVVVALHNGSVRWITNQGNGSWSALTVITEHPISGVLHTMEIVDVNRDGELDIVIGWPNYLAWVENVGGGNFTTPHLINDAFTGVVDIGAADFDQDNDIDLVIRASLQGMQLVLRLDQRNGTFILQDFSASPNGFSPNRLKVTDYDEDTYADVFYGWGVYIVTFNEFLGVINNEGGNFAETSGLGAFNGYVAHDFNTIDLDSDGDEDLVKADDRLLEYQLNNGGVFSGTYDTLGISTLTIGTRRIMPFHLDHDGDIDILLQEKYHLVLFENITAMPPPIANFNQEASNGIQHFTDLSHYNPTEWYWTFGDGSESTQQNPIHYYSAAGNYEVCLTVGNEAGEDTFCHEHEVGSYPEPCFAPSALTVSNISQTTARFAWEQTGEQIEYWEIEIVTEGDIPTGEPTLSNLSNPYYFWNGATQNTSYKLYVRGVCENGPSEWTGPLSFVTHPGCGDAFYDTGGPSGNHASQQFNRYIFCPDEAGDAVQIDFTNIDLGAFAELNVRNGDTGSSPMLLFDIANPVTVTSSATNGCLTVDFASSSDETAAGWEAEIRCVSVLNCGTTFYDEGGADGDYASGTDQLWTICPEGPDEQVRLDFTQVAIAPGDQLQLVPGSSFPHPNGEYLSTDLQVPNIYISNAADGCLTLHFTAAANSPGAAGWVAEALCIPTPVCAEPGSFYVDITAVNTLELNWYAMYNIYPLELEVVAHNAPPTGLATVTDISTMPYEWTDGEADVLYDFYLRGTCADGGFTQWVGPASLVFVNNEELPDVIQYLLLSPNPTTDQIQLEARFKANVEVQLEITNLQGQTIRQMPSWRGQHIVQQLDMTSYAAGTYLLRMKVGEEWISQRLVKVK